jgi:hypothetical protein
MNVSTHTMPLVINVGAISGNSGVYVAERNLIVGVSGHSKSNNGFGNISSNNLLWRNVNVVDDRDVIDTPIDDRDVKIHNEALAASSRKVTRIGFESINVVTMSQNSGIFVGDVQITGLDSHTKQNSAQGATSGSQNVEARNLNCVLDTDVIDTPIFDQDYKALNATGR